MASGNSKRIRQCEPAQLTGAPPSSIWIFPSSVFIRDNRTAVSVGLLRRPLSYQRVPALECDDSTYIANDEEQPVYLQGLRDLKLLCRQPSWLPFGCESF